MPNGIGEEDNNNTHIRRGSEGSENSEGWMEVASQDSEPTITSFTHSYRYVKFHNTHIRRGSEGGENSEGWMEVTKPVKIQNQQSPSLHIPIGMYSFITHICNEVARVVRTVRAGWR